MNRIFVTGCIALLAGTSACNKGPAHLPKAQMAPIIADLQLADVYSAMVRDTAKRGGEKNQDSLALWTTQILARHRISRDDFTKSMDWYRDHPAELDSLFAAVIPILEKAKR